MNEVTELRASDFGKDFVWGAATASYQIEGAHDEDGKGPSIWDDFARRGKIKNGDTGNVACDHYHRVREDVALMSELGLDAYRFSISWPRVFPDGTRAGGLNAKGMDFYKRLAEALHSAGIRPYATLYHWDLPLELERRGGWASREIADHFAEYAQTCARELGDLVEDWIIINEPFVFLMLGYGIRYFPPQRFGLRTLLKASHYCMLAQGRAARAVAAERPGANIGTTISTLAGYPRSDGPRDIRALERHDAFFNRLYVDPVVGRGYPVESLPVLRKMERYIEDGDMDTVQFPFHFLGINHYSRAVVRPAWYVPFLKFREQKLPKHAERTDMGWEIYPPGIYQILKKFGDYPEIPALMITENGAAFPEGPGADGRVRDERRVAYYRNYLARCLQAQQEGVNLTGYFAWSLLDNLEWREGYAKRFGIVHVDFETQKRTIKDSGLWYRDFLKR